MPAKKRSANGDHSVYKVQSGKDKGKFIGQIVIGYNDNGVAKKKRFVGKKRAEVKSRMDAYIEQKRIGIDQAGAKRCYGEWVLDWLELYKKPPIIRQSTWDNYTIWIETHIIPAIGDIPLEELGPEDIQTLYNGMIDRQLSSSSIAKVHQIVNASLEKAVNRKLIAWNPAKETARPSVVHRDVKALTESEMDKFVAAINTKDIRWRAALITLLGTGLRIGELLGLEWGDIDLDAQEMRIVRGVSRIKGGQKIEDPKTFSGKRMIPLPGEVSNVLREWKSCRKIVSINVDHEAVFRTSTGERINYSNFARMFRSVRKTARVPEEVTIHGLRHTYATRLLEAGESLKVIMDLLGHSDIATTANLYSHVQPKLKERAASKMDQFLGNKKSSG